ncbi:MAG: sugar phosphate isomerase/epimerase family protein [Candidatus Bipolaricaulia bacterium]
MTKQISGADGIEIVYPQDFDVPETTVSLVNDLNLTVSAVNVNLKSEKKWRFGSLTSTDSNLRAEAVEYLKTAMDLAAELGANMITVCLLIDGWDYNFQVDYRNQWRWLVAGLKTTAGHRQDVNISLEYKPYVGITLDVGHALAAGETPAAEACLASDAERLFHLHFNDNNRIWDWDMLPGAVNLWDMMETLFYLNRMEWQGWIAYDVFSRQGDPADTLATAIGMIKTLESWVEENGHRVEELIETSTPAYAFRKLITEMLF